MPGRLLIFSFLLCVLASCGPQTYHYRMPDTRTTSQLSVQSQATVKAQPDLVQIRFGVITDAETADLALGDNNRRMESLMELLAAAGLDSADMKTGQFQIRPEWSVPPRPTPSNWRRQIVAYRVSNELHVETTRVDLAGELLSLGHTAGANQIGGLQFGLADPELYRQQAIAEATGKALRKARTLAAAAGATLGPIVSLSLDPNGAYAEPRLMKLERVAAAGEAVPVAAGTVDVSAGVSVVYRLVEGPSPGEEAMQ